MGNEKAERIQTSFLNAAEKKALIWLAHRQPRWMTSDMLTYIGVLGVPWDMHCLIIVYIGFGCLHSVWSSIGMVIVWMELWRVSDNCNVRSMASSLTIHWMRSLFASCSWEVAFLPYSRWR